VESAPSTSTVPEPDYTRNLEPASTPSVDLLSMPATALALETLPEPTSSRNVESATETSSEPAQSRFVESLPETESTRSKPVQSSFVESLPEVDSTRSFGNTSNTEPSRSLDTTNAATSTFANDPIYEPLSTSNTSTIEPLSFGNASATGPSSYENTLSFDDTPTTGASNYDNTPNTGASSFDNTSSTLPSSFANTSSTVPSTFDNASSVEPSSTRTGFASEPSAHSSSHGSYGGLAAPLPATFLGTGAAHGATDLETVRGISSDSAYPENANGTGLNPTSEQSSYSAPKLSPIPPSNDRTTSLASVTAIRHGHEGERSSSSLARDALGASALATVAEGQRSTTRGTGPEHTTSLTPGAVEDGVGHPSSRNTDLVEPTRVPTTTSNTTPEVGIAPTTSTTAEPTKPAVRDEQQPVTNTYQAPTGPHAPYPMEGHDQPKSNVFGTGKDTTGHEILKHDGVAVPDVPATSTTTGATGTTPISPITSGHHGVKEDVGGHHRSGSTSSVGADGKKKAGFLGKLKEKLHHREFVFPFHIRDFRESELMRSLRQGVSD
jgi:hypothetical protein